jgi:hypothetical protein
MPKRELPMNPDDLSSLRDDMIAYIEGHGMRRFHCYVSEEMNSVMWDPGENPDSWKDFVEVAKGSGASFVTMNEAALDQEDVDFVLERLRFSAYMNSEDMEEARMLRLHVGKLGFVQLGYAYQGIMFLYEVSTGWYERYQRLMDLAEESGIMIDEHDQDDER